MLTTAFWLLGSMNLFFTQGRIYAIMAMRSGEGAKTSNEPNRFANSIA